MAAELLFSLSTDPVSTVGSLDSVNAQVAAAGLQRRALLPDLVGDCYSSEPLPPATDDMPPRRRAAGASARLQTKHITARKQGARGAPAQPSADMSREKVADRAVAV